MKYLILTHRQTQHIRSRVDHAGDDVALWVQNGDRKNSWRIEQHIHSILLQDGMTLETKIEVAEDFAPILEKALTDFFGDLAEIQMGDSERPTTFVRLTFLDLSRTISADTETTESGKTYLVLRNGDERRGIEIVRHIPHPTFTPYSPGREHGGIFVEIEDKDLEYFRHTVEHFYHWNTAERFVKIEQCYRDGRTIVPIVDDVPENGESSAHVPADATESQWLTTLPEREGGYWVWDARHQWFRLAHVESHDGLFLVHLTGDGTTFDLGSPELEDYIWFPISQPPAPPAMPKTTTMVLRIEDGSEPNKLIDDINAFLSNVSSGKAKLEMVNG